MRRLTPSSRRQTTICAKRCGSFVREEQTDESDVDLLVSLQNHSLDNFLALIDFAESIFERKVDVITEGSITPRNGQVICREVEYVSAS